MENRFMAVGGEGYCGEMDGVSAQRRRRTAWCVDCIGADRAQRCCGVMDPHAPSASVRRACRGGVVTASPYLSSVCAASWESVTVSEQSLETVPTPSNVRIV